MPQSILKKQILSLPRPAKRLVVVACDVLLCAAATMSAMDLRFEAWLPWGAAHTRMFLLGLGIALPLFITQGLYRAVFRYAGTQMLFVLSKALLAYTLLYVVVFTVVGTQGVPKSMGLLQPAFFALGVLASRLWVRQWLGGLARVRRHLAGPRVLIYGAGSAGLQLAAGLGLAPEVQALGYLDDDERLHGQVLNGLPVFDPAEIDSVIARLKVTQVYLAIPSASRSRRQEIIESLRPYKLEVRTLPGLAELVSGQVQVSDLRELDIEDLLGREAVPANPLMMGRNISGKVVLVTGAGGSIGSELCRQIVRQAPERLLLVELNEFALYEIERELKQALAQEGHESVELIALLADVRNRTRMQEIMRTWRPHTVYHAAAYKHVPLVEHNPAEGVRNNVLGTWVTAEEALVNGVRNFVLVSTDKAVRPTNVMGASKRLAEMVLQAMAQQVEQQGSRMRLSMVRFGNVLGSSGSVVPLFRKQIQQGGPITLTDLRVTRYFMTIPEAAQLVIQAGAMASGGDVFVLDMGDSVKIIDLARRMVELSGLTVQDEANPAGDIAIEVTGLRPGEKLYEELLIGDNPMPTQHPRIMKAHEEYLPWPQLMEQLNQLMQAVDVNDVPTVRGLIQALVPGYRPEGELVDWVWLEQAKAA